MNTGIQNYLSFYNMEDGSYLTFIKILEVIDPSNFTGLIGLG